MIQKYGVIILFGAAAVVIMLIVIISHHQRHAAVIPQIQIYPATEGVQKLLTVEPKAPQQRSISILFTGNSLTAANNLPVMLARIAGSDTTNPIRLEIQSDLHGGKDLAEVWQDGQLLPLFGSRKWDYVVLQLDNGWVGNTEKTDQLYRTVQVLANAVKTAGDQPLIFMPWIRAPGSKWYAKNADFQSPAYMQQSIDYYTQDVAKKAGNTPVLAVADFWALCAREHPNINLYAPNGADPSFAGTYLTALLFYRAITGRPLQGVTLVPPTVSAADAATLREIAGK